MFRGAGKLFLQKARSLDHANSKTIQRAPSLKLKFPSLECLAYKLATSLTNEQHNSLLFCDHPTLIQRYGGVKKLVKDAMLCINKLIKDLEAQDVTVPRQVRFSANRALPCEALIIYRLRSIQEAQGTAIRDPRPGSKGYCNFVSDDRDDQYLRFYIGQATVLVFRIYYHSLAILKGKADTLQYYILQLGNGSRTANFLLLWDLLVEVQRVPQHRSLMQNFLQMLFCRVFESLPGSILHEFFGFSSNDTGEYLELDTSISCLLCSKATAVAR